MDEKNRNDGAHEMTWHGDTPRHREAANKGKLQDTLREPMQPTSAGKINWNFNVRDGIIIQMPPQEYMERVNIFNRIGMSRIIDSEIRAKANGHRGIGYYPPLSEQSYISILNGIKAGNEMDIPNLIYHNNMLENQEGFHRALVSRDLGIETIPVHVIGEMPSRIIRMLNQNWNENLIEQVKAINALKGKHIQKIPLSEFDKEELEDRIGGDPKRSPENNITFGQMERIGKALEYYLQKNGIAIEEIYFTGSRVKGYARPDSDLDIMVIVKDKHLWNSPQEYTSLNKKIEADIKPLEEEHGMKFELLLGKTIEDFGFGQDWNTRYGYFAYFK